MRPRTWPLRGSRALALSRLAGSPGQRIGKAVAEVQFCRVAVLAEIVESLAREMRLIDSHGFDHHARVAKQRIALPDDLSAKLTLDDNSLRIFGSAERG